MKAAILSGSRADAGALVAVEQALARAGVLTDWFSVPGPIARQDSRLTVCSATALACSATAKYLHQNTPAIVLVHGDRYEILGAATAAFLLGLPIAHLGGGDITEGSQDDSIRHSITKLSHLHFATCDESARRLVQLGEAPDRVFNVGDPGIDVFFEDSALLGRSATLKTLGLSVERYFLVAFHPNTLGDTSSELTILMESLKRIQKALPDVGLVLLDPNKDAGFALIEQQFQRLVGEKVRYCVNLPRRVYLSTLKHAVALIGNSSAALYEAPSAGTWVINLGDRQRGRLIMDNWLGTARSVDSLVANMQKAAKIEHKPSRYNPYGDGFACDRIAKILTSMKPSDLLRKHFNDINEDSCLTKFGKRYMLNANGADTPKKNLYDGLCVSTGQAPNGQHCDSLILAAAQAPAPGFWPEKDSQ